MKVTDISQIKALAPGKLPEASKPSSPEQPDTTDKVTTEASRSLAAAVGEAARSTNSAGREAKLQAIEAAVKQGTYRPDPQRIAQEILNDAELAARLQAMFWK
jgi:negative regulator of flagellin synthesis FlgM